MTETQKWIASISGAVIGQLLVLAFFYLLVIDSRPTEAAARQEPEPREVTVMLSQLLEQAQLEPEPPQPAEPEQEQQEEEPEAETPDFGKPFVDTDSNTAAAEAPVNARYESDKNTTASTEYLPDPNLPQTSGPTMRGDERIENLSLANTEYQDGDIVENAAPTQASSMPTPPTPQPNEAQEAVKETLDTPPVEPIPDPLEQNEPTLDEPSDTEGEAEEALPGEADTPPTMDTADTAIQPDTDTIGTEAQMASSTESFIDPSQAQSTLRAPAEHGQIDQKAVTLRQTDDTGEPREQEQKAELKEAQNPIAGELEDLIKQEKAAQQEAQQLKELQESLFNPGYLAWQRKNNQNGDITTLGEGSVDAESTEVGKYKKAVHQAIGQRWHQYRMDKADQVTWGVLRLKFNVLPNGNIKNLHIVKKEASELVTEFSMRAVVDADIPPMPPDVRARLGSRGLEMNYNIIIH